MPRTGERPAVQPPLTALDEPAAPAVLLDDRPLFASSAAEPQTPSRGGMKIWLAAAVSLVLGIAIGFASGYRSGQGAAAAVRDQGGARSTSGASPGQTFSESKVGDPVRIEDAPIVPAPEAGSVPGSAGSAPAASDRAGTRPAEPVGRVPAGTRSSAGGPAAVPPATRSPAGRVPPEARSSAGGPAAVSPGPGSIQVLSRPAGAEVTLDGRLIGKTPMLIPDVAAGSHTIRLELATFNPWTTTVEVKGNAVRVAASLEQ